MAQNLDNIVGINKDGQSFMPGLQLIGDSGEVSYIGTNQGTPASITVGEKFTWMHQGNNLLNKTWSSIKTWKTGDIFIFTTRSYPGLECSVCIVQPDKTLFPLTSANFVADVYGYTCQIYQYRFTNL